MDIFSEFEGLSNENLSSALLRNLIINSNEFREAFLSLLSANSPIGPLYFSSHFSCLNEYPTKSKLGPGYIDLLIQLDDVVIGIENKFFAGFTENQPEKYLESIHKVSEYLSKINNTQTKIVLFVLCPESRKTESKNKIKSINNSAVITWENVLQKIENIKIENPVSSVVNNEFVKYLKRKFSFIYDYETKYHHLRNKFPSNGSSLQNEFVSRIWPYFPKSGNRISRGVDWLGYYFYQGENIEDIGWYGFIPNEKIITQTQNKVELIIASTYKPKLSEEFKEIELKNKRFLVNPKKTHAWVINFDKNWNKVEVWTKKLSPFHEIINE